MTRVAVALLAGAVAVGHLGTTPVALPGPRVSLSEHRARATSPFSLPIPDGAVTERELGAPHHDYPASDLMVPSGTPVFAAHPGRVTTHAGSRCGLGVTVRSVDGYRSVSCHLAVVTVESGVEVGAGDVVGLSGDTGNAAGVPHLHFHLRDPAGRYLCPQPLLEAWSQGIARAPLDDPVHDGCSFPREGR